jgi:hypothetical protein
MIQVVIENEQGLQIGSAVDFSPSLIPAETDARFVCLRFVDPYGDTTFNHIQAPYLEADLQLLSSECGAPEQKAELQQILSLVSTCRAAVHLYIKFVGD